MANRVVINVTGVEIAGVRYDIDDAVYDLAEVKAEAVKVDPSLANQEPYIVGTTVKFQKPAGNKG